MPTPNGPAIRALREERGLKVAALAAWVGVPTKTLKNIESQSQPTSMPILCRLREALGVADVDDLISKDADAPERHAS